MIPLPQLSEFVPAPRAAGQPSTEELSQSVAVLQQQVAGLQIDRDTLHQEATDTYKGCVKMEENMRAVYARQQYAREYTVRLAQELDAAYARIEQLEELYVTGLRKLEQYKAQNQGPRSIM
jgi:hypothetical protein